MTHFAYITHILYCTLYKLQTTCLCVKYFVKNLHRAETIYTGGARGARDKYQVCFSQKTSSLLHTGTVQKVKTHLCTYQQQYT